jgi:hypothetical protein
LKGAAAFFGPAGTPGSPVFTDFLAINGIALKAGDDYVKLL